MKALTYIACALTLAACFAAAYTYSATRAEVAMLRRQVREQEIRMYEWRGRLDALYEVMVEIHVIDKSQIIMVDQVLPLMKGD